MKLIGRTVAAVLLALCGLATWGAGSFVIVLLTGEWRGGAPVATPASYWVMVPFSAAFVVMMFFAIRHVDRSLRG